MKNSQLLLSISTTSNIMTIKPLKEVTNLILKIFYFYSFSEPQKVRYLQTTIVQYIDADIAFK